MNLKQKLAKLIFHFWDFPPLVEPEYGESYNPCLMVTQATFDGTAEDPVQQRYGHLVWFIPYKREDESQVLAEWLIPFDGQVEPVTAWVFNPEDGRVWGQAETALESDRIHVVLTDDELPGSIYQANNIDHLKVVVIIK